VKPNHAEEIIEVARGLFKQSPDMMSFFHQMFGASGAMRTRLKTQRERLDFQQTPEYTQIQTMLMTLEAMSPKENKGLGIRIPDSLHQKLTKEKFDFYTSLNKLATAKLRTPVTQALVSEHQPKKDEEEFALTVQIPKSLHICLKMEASDFRASMTKLAIVKLEQPVNTSFLDDWEKKT